MRRRTSALAAATAGALALDGYALGAKECLQVLGGIGFTWEHDVHLHLKRAMADRQLMGEPDTYCQEVAAAAGGGARRALAADLPAEAEATREELAPVVAGLAALEGEARRRRMVDVGLVMPHWPKPYGRDAGAVEQVVIEGLLASSGVDRPHIGIGAWALPPIIARGTDLQRERWVDPTLMGELHWCQLFSEPGAGSDLASLSTRAERTEGGWLLTGQKVWTSMARDAQWGICLARTDPTAPKHLGITYFVVDMTLGRAGHPAPPRAHRGGDVQRGVPRRRLRPRRLRDRGGQRRLGPRPYDAGQRAGLHVLGVHLRHRGRVVAPTGGPAERLDDPQPVRCGSAGSWSRRSR